ncbi:MAG: tRNA (adenosine(37)-N6)-threonylcarbamoyltransferase complex transferase subunit TsaD [Deltaproteobacteria bacterium]|nr:tRNA (adenosine(37)-N6)-threonylcarbamoyltransferase complex transferase subunit TsaD [Deltaproteobacteria bacterium]
MNVLGIESSCDETAAAVVEDGRRVRSSVVWSQVALHAPYRGVVPEIASRNHLRSIVPVVDEALAKAGTDLSGIDGIAVTIGPGLIGSLLVGVQFAKALALGRGLPVVGVNHLEAHVMAAFLVPDRDPPRFPFVALAVSGGHTSLYLLSRPGEVALLGRTLDDAAGEAMDKAAAQLGLPYPGGVAIDRVSEGRDRAAVKFPRSMIKDPTLDMSFSGLKTAMRHHLLKRPEALGADEVGDISASFQEAVVDVLVHKTIAAARANAVRDVVIAGGVAANRRLRARMASAAEAAGLVLHPVPISLCTDNAAMIAGLGHRYLFGELSSAPLPRGLEMDPFVRHVADGW